jgi:cytochrome P450
MTEQPRRPDSLPGLDVVGHDVYARRVPHEAFNRYRRDAPVAWINESPTDAGLPGSGFWSLTRHDDIVAVHKGWRTFSSEVGGTELEELAPDALDARRTMLETDPPRHTKLRQLVNPAFSKAAVERYAAHAEAIIESLITAALAQPRIDGVYDLARELPIRMLTEVLGVPEEDAPQLFDRADQIIYHADPDYSGAVVDKIDTDPYRLLPFRSPVTLEVFDWVTRLAEARRQVPAGDVLTVLANAQVDGVALTDRERGTFFLLLLIAGNETTRHSLAHALLAFARQPEQLDRLRNNPSLLDSAVEEVLRWTCPQLHFRRTATVDTELRGVRIAAGDKVVTWYIAANRDPEVFAEPFRFDIARTPNPHVTFGGGGPHLCIGQWMARLEVRVMLQALMDRVARIELVGRPQRVRSNFINGLKHLPLTLVAT